jgi:hypothetical protein
MAALKKSKPDEYHDNGARYLTFVRYRIPFVTTVYTEIVRRLDRRAVTNRRSAVDRDVLNARLETFADLGRLTSSSGFLVAASAVQWHCADRGWLQEAMWHAAWKRLEAIPGAISRVDHSSHIAIALV